MSRRARHSSSDLRELFIGSTTGLIREHGLSAVSARTIARQIGYTAGSLYNVFDDLDDLLLLTEGRQLDRLLESLHAEFNGARANKTADERLREAARLYLRFCLENNRLWNVVVVHQTGANKVLPAWYSEKLDALVAVFDDALAYLIDDPPARALQAKALWASVHGLASLVISGKVPNIAETAAEPMLDAIVAAFQRPPKAEAPAARVRTAAQPLPPRAQIHAHPGG